jgi:hypothetical protein
MDKRRLKERIDKYKQRLDLYYKAEEAILDGAQHYEIGTRKLTRADLAEIRKMITTLEKELDSMECEYANGSRRKCIRVIPRDV